MVPESTRRTMENSDTEFTFPASQIFAMTQIFQTLRDLSQSSSFDYLKEARAYFVYKFGVDQLAQSPELSCAESQLDSLMDSFSDFLGSSFVRTYHSLPTSPYKFDLPPDPSYFAPSCESDALDELDQYQTMDHMDIDFNETNVAPMQMHYETQPLDYYTPTHSPLTPVAGPFSHADSMRDEDSSSAYCAFTLLCAPFIVMGLTLAFFFILFSSCIVSVAL